MENQGEAFYIVVGKQKHDVQKTTVTWLLKYPIFMKTFSFYDGRCLSFTKLVPSPLNLTKVLNFK